MSTIAPIAAQHRHVEELQAGERDTPIPTIVISAPVRLSGRRSQAKEPTATKPQASMMPR